MAVVWQYSLASSQVYVAVVSNNRQPIPTQLPSTHPLGQGPLVAATEVVSLAWRKRRPSRRSILTLLTVVLGGPVMKAGKISPGPETVFADVISKIGRVGKVNSGMEKYE